MLESRHPWEKESKWSEVHQHSSVLPGKFLGCNSQSRKPSRTSSLPKLRTQSWKFREVKATINHSTEHERTELHKGDPSERKHTPEIGNGFPSGFQLSDDGCTNVRKQPGWKGIEGTILRPHTGLGILPVPISQSRENWYTQGIDREPRRVWPQ